MHSIKNCDLHHISLLYNSMEVTFSVVVLQTPNNALVHILGGVLLAMFGGKKNNVTFFSPFNFGWAGQLSPINAHFRPCLWHVLSNLVTQFMKVVLVIQAFLWVSYRVGKALTLLKHLGFADLSRTSRGCFYVLDMFSHHRGYSPFIMSTAMTVFIF